jgi:hypothetical protein
VVIVISVTDLLKMLKFRRSGEPQFELQRDLVQDFQLKESSRYKKIEEKSVEAETLDAGHGNWEVGRKTSSRRVKITVPCE